MSSQQKCLSQFDLMMQLAQKHDSAASVFDDAQKTSLRVPQNNFLFDQVTIRDGTAQDEDASGPPSRAD